MPTVTLIVDMQADFFTHGRLACMGGSLVSDTSALAGATRDTPTGTPG